MLLLSAILFVFSFMAFALSAVCGGGASFILIPMLNWVLPGAQIPAALSIGTATSSVSRMLLFFRTIRWDIVLWFVPPAIPAVWLGSWLLASLNPFYLELIMGLFLLSNLPLIFKPGKNEAMEKHIPKIYLTLIGSAAGFVSGLTGAVGLLFNRFYLRYGLSKEEIVATRAANELLLHILKLFLYASFGLLHSRVWWYGSIIAVAAVCSSWAVKRILPSISEYLFQRIGYTAMVISGIIMFLNASGHILKENQASISYAPNAEGIDTRMQWRKSTFELEFEYDEGFELEYPIQLAALPVKEQEKISEIASNADQLIVEEVYGMNKHYYEAYVYKRGKLEKYDLYP